MASRTEPREEQVERIVRDVLAHLQANFASSPAAASESRSIRPAANSHPAEVAGSSRLILTNRLITLDVLDGKLGSIREICAQDGAVITPAANDAIREHGIRLLRTRAQLDGQVQLVNSEPGTGAVVGVAACAVEPTAVGRIRHVLGGPVELLARVGLVDVVREMSEHVVLGGMTGLLFTVESVAALCLANRHRGVRAIAGKDAQNVVQDAHSVGANLLVVRPVGLSTWQQLEMVKAFVKRGVTDCPEPYRDALG